MQQDTRLTAGEISEQRYVRSIVDAVRSSYRGLSHYDHKDDYIALPNAAKDQVIAEISTAFKTASDISFKWKGKLRNSLKNLIEWEFNLSADYDSNAAKVPSRETLSRFVAVSSILRNDQKESLLSLLGYTALHADLLDQYTILVSDDKKREEILAHIRGIEDEHARIDASVVAIDLASEEIAFRDSAKEEVDAI